MIKSANITIILFLTLTVLSTLIFVGCSQPGQTGKNAAPAATNATATPTPTVSPTPNPTPSCDTQLFDNLYHIYWTNNDLKNDMPHFLVSSKNCKLTVYGWVINEVKYVKVINIARDAKYDGYHGILGLDVLNFFPSRQQFVDQKRDAIACDTTTEHQCGELCVPKDVDCWPGIGSLVTPTATPTPKN